ncbi:MAG: helix-turn-helix transcriptional regulator [Ilumatobacteraceae bacterium]
MNTLQQQARALGDPTRHAIFRFIADHDGPAGVAEMTSHFEVNHNAVRQHLAKLVAAALVVETTAAPRGRGRPRLEYSVDPAAESRWGVTGPYERLSVLLAEIIRTGATPVEVGRRAGRRHGVATSSSDAALDEIARVMASEGFDPEVRRRRDRVEIALRNCPFESAALADPDTVCAIHLGIAEGIAEGTDIAVDELIAKDPRRADCRLRLQGRPLADHGHVAE